jgi:excisionase family DNA binding protein
MGNHMDANYYTPDELAAKWGVTAQTVLNYIKRGELVCYRQGKFYRIPKDVAEEWEQTNRQLIRESK